MYVNFDQMLKFFSIFFGRTQWFFLFVFTHCTIHTSASRILTWSFQHYCSCYFPCECASVTFYSCGSVYRIFFYSRCSESIFFLFSVQMKIFKWMLIVNNMYSAYACATESHISFQ